MKLYHAPLGENISVINEYDVTSYTVIDILRLVIREHRQRAFTVMIDDEVYVTSSFYCLCQFIRHIAFIDEKDTNVHIHEWKSYEDAFEEALDFKSTTNCIAGVSPLLYNEEK